MGRKEVKKCRLCGEEKPLSEYHKDKGSKDGHTSRCKACVKHAGSVWYSVNAKYVSERGAAYYKDNVEKCAASRADWRNRNAAHMVKVKAAYYKKNAEHIKEAVSSYKKTDAGKETKKRSNAIQRIAHPDRYAANSAVGNAIRSGSLVRLPCWVCGETEVEGHHPAYSMPLDVIWLCKKHHDEIHYDKHTKEEQQNAS